MLIIDVCQRSTLVFHGEFIDGIYEPLNRHRIMYGTPVRSLGGAFSDAYGLLFDFEINRHCFRIPIAMSIGITVTKIKFTSKFQV